MRRAPSTTNLDETPAGELDAPQAGGGAAENQRAAEGTEQELAPALEESLKKAERAAQEHHEAWLRAKAEADNIRKRAQTEIANAHKFALENFASELLAVKDSLEAALATENATVESMKAGVELTLKQLGDGIRQIQHQRDQPSGAEIRSAPPPGDQHAGVRCRAQYRGAGAAEGLSPARPGDPPRAGGGSESQGLKVSLLPPYRKNQEFANIAGKPKR